MRQGGNPSPALFRVYTDKLLLRLTQSAVRCQTGPFFWCDSIRRRLYCLTPSPSAKGTPFRIDEKFAAKNFAACSAKKTKCIRYTSKQTVHTFVQTSVNRCHQFLFTATLLILCQQLISCRSHPEFTSWRRLRP